MSTVNRSSGTGSSRDAAGTTGTGTRRQTGAGSASGRAASSRTSSARAPSTTRQASGEAAPQPDVRLPQEVQPDVRHHQAAFQLPEVPLLIEVRDDAEETLIMG